MEYDFSGWATRNDIRCSDGRTIRKDAFKHNDGNTVPLVWNHQHNDPFNVLGHAVLENRAEGVYAYCSLNDTEQGNNAREYIDHGDINALSIYANHLTQKGGDVLHGDIREVSLVLAGANPGAYIDSIMHSEEEALEDSDEAIVYTDEKLELFHADNHDTDTKSDEKEGTDVAESEKTVQDVFDELTDEQKDVVYFMIGQALEDAGVEADDSAAHADSDDKTVQDVFDELTEEQKNVVYFIIGQALEDAGVKKGDDNMRHSIFDEDQGYEENVLTHADMTDILNDAKRTGSLKDSFLAHTVTDDDGNTVTYGVANIDYLFPEDREYNSGAPKFLNGKTDWVSVVMGGVHHTPFSRVKSTFADITMEEARAKGYVKANQKTEEVFALLKRTTSPQTIYKKQKLDRDDIIDITDFDVVAWIKGEMRIKLDEEIARAILIGDGRGAASPDKIDPLHIRPIWTDESLYAINQNVGFAPNDTDDQKAKKIIRSAVKGRKTYQGSGNPILFTTEDYLTDMLLLEDSTGRRIYESEASLATAMRVSKIVTVAAFENKTREVSGVTRDLVGIIVNLNDYNVGADKGGALSLFDDFDIDYNRQKYLIETRCSGALIAPYSAIILESWTESQQPAG